MEVRRRSPNLQSFGTDRDEDDFFERNSVLFYFVIIMGFGLYEVVCFQTHIFPFEGLGGPGRRLLFLTDNYMPFLRLGFVASVLAHIVESIYAHHICRSLNLSQSATIKWIGQTFLMGYASLRILIAYSEKKTKGKST